MRVWEPFLTERDLAHLAAVGPTSPIGFGTTPALLLIDHSKAVLGDEPRPLLASIETHPLSMGIEAWEAVGHTCRLLEAFRDKKGLIVHTTMLVGAHTPHEFYSAFRASPCTRTRGEAGPAVPTGQAEGWDIVDDLEPRPDEVVIAKLAPSAFHGTPLSGVLRNFGVDTLVVTGNSTSGCVRATVVDAASELFRTVVVEECVYDRTEASHAINLFDMDQKYADILPLDDVLAWIEAAEAGFTYPNESEADGGRASQNRAPSRRVL